MKKIIITLAALATVSTAALAERNYDLRDSQEAMGSFTLPIERNADAVNSGIDVNTLAVSPSWDNDAREQRRLDEKNGYNG
jgi:hypothetical protein